jgi:hypothetical protein
LWGSSALFAAVHFNMVSFLPLLVFALVLVYLYETFQNLLAPIVAHSLFNAANFLMLIFQDQIEPLAALDMNELELIARLTRSLPANASVVAGAGTIAPCWIAASPDDTCCSRPTPSWKVFISPRKPSRNKSDTKRWDAV